MRSSSSLWLVPLLLIPLLIPLAGAGCHLIYPFGTTPPDGAADADRTDGSGDAHPGDGPKHDGAAVDGPKKDGAAVDAPPLDASGCPSQCTGCDTTTKTCTITESKNVKVICPANWHCVLTCSGTDACRQGVDCSAAASCDITCGGSGDDQCKEGVIICGKGFCKIACTGKDSCQGGIDCSQSCACHLACSGALACKGGTIKCPSAASCCPLAKCLCP